MNSFTARLALMALISGLASVAAQAPLHDLSKPRRLIGGSVANIATAIQWHLDHIDATSGRLDAASNAGRPLPAWVYIQGEITGEFAWGGWKVQGTADGTKATVVLRNPPVAEFAEFQKLKKEMTSAPNPPSKETEAYRQKSRGYDLSGEFPVRCLALRTRETCEGLPIFDRGQIYNPWTIQGLSVTPAQVRSGSPSSMDEFMIAGEIPPGSLRVQLAFLDAPGDEFTYAYKTTVQTGPEPSSTTTTTFHDKWGQPMLQSGPVPNLDGVGGSREITVRKTNWLGDQYLNRFQIVDTNGYALSSCLGCMRTKSGKDPAGQKYTRSLAFDWPCDQSGHRLALTNLVMLQMVDLERKLAAYLNFGREARAFDLLRLKSERQMPSPSTNAMNHPMPLPDRAAGHADGQTVRP